LTEVHLYEILHRLSDSGNGSEKSTKFANIQGGDNGMKGLQRAVSSVGLTAAIAMGVGACQGKNVAETRPITPSVEVNKSRAPIGSPIEVTYRFEVGPECEPIEKDYKIFVHFLESHDELIFTDDHQPPEPTNSWSPGSTIEYSRTIFLPLFPYLGTANIEMGFYIPETGERLGLVGSDNGAGVRVGEITLLDQKENIFLVYKEGWHQLESSPENPSIEWQWTKKEAVCSFKNPKTDSVLYLDADTNIQAFDSPLEVSLMIGENEIVRFQVESRDRFLKKIPIPASSLGLEDWVDLRIVNEESFVPSEKGLGTDTRDLGLRVYHLYIAPEPGT
jgi:hypothetical protein